MLRAGAHGTFGGIMSWANGGSFLEGFAVGGLSSLAGSGMQALGMGGDYLPMATGLTGAGTAWDMGGDPMGGFMQGFSIGAFNHGWKRLSDGGWTYETDEVIVYGRRFMKTGFNINAAIAYLNAHAHSSSRGKCSWNVQDAIKAGGIDVGSVYRAGRKYGPLLEEWGFHKETSSLTNYLPIRGDIAVIQGYQGGTADSNGIPYGHIQMYNGDQWVSDFFQTRPFWPGRDYERYMPTFHIYRW